MNRRSFELIESGLATGGSLRVGQEFFEPLLAENDAEAGLGLEGLELAEALAEEAGRGGAMSGDEGGVALGQWPFFAAVSGSDGPGGCLR